MNCINQIWLFLKYMEVDLCKKQQQQNMNVKFVVYRNNRYCQ